MFPDIPSHSRYTPCRNTIFSCLAERVVQALSVTDFQPGTATGTGELAEQPPPPSAGTGSSTGNRGEAAAGARGAQPTGASEPACTRRPGTNQTPRLAKTTAVAVHVNRFQSTTA